MDKAGNDDSQSNIDSNESTYALSYLKVFIDTENSFRNSIHHHLTETMKGKILAQISAIVHGSSTVVYIVLTYNKDCPLILNAWYNQIEYIICLQMMITFLLTIYSTPHRYTYITSYESCILLSIFLPIVSMRDVSMLAQWYFLVAISRHLRVSYLVLVMLKYHENELGETDVDRQKNIIMIILILIIIFCTGIF